MADLPWLRLSCLQIKQLLNLNRNATIAVFDHYATSLATPKDKRVRRRSFSATRTPYTDDSARKHVTTAPKTDAEARTPTRLMSLQQLYQFCQDFGVMPDVADMAGVQVRWNLNGTIFIHRISVASLNAVSLTLQAAFAIVKTRLLSDTEDFVDLLCYSEFEEVRSVKHV